MEMKRWKRWSQERPPLVRAEDVLDENEYPEGDARSEPATTPEEIERLLAAVESKRRFNLMMNVCRIPGTEYGIGHHGETYRFTDEHNVISDASPEAQEAATVFVSRLRPRRTP